MNRRQWMITSGAVLASESSRSDAAGSGVAAPWTGSGAAGYAGQVPAERLPPGVHLPDSEDRGQEGQISRSSTRIVTASVRRSRWTKW